jgi:hypothetical protein
MLVCGGSRGVPRSSSSPKRSARRSWPSLLARIACLLLVLTTGGCRAILGIHDLPDEPADASGSLEGGGGGGGGNDGGANDASLDGSHPGDGGAPTDATHPDSTVDSGGDSGLDSGPTEAGPAPAPHLEAVQPSLDFGTIVVGQTGSTGQVQIKNTGTAATAPLTTAITGAGFSITADTCASAKLQPALSCTITVALDTSSALSRSGQITVTDTTTDQTSVALLADVVKPGALSVMPTSQDFTGIQIGSTGTPVTFMVTNTGMTSTGTLTVSLTGTNASEFTMVNQCSGKTLAPTAMCSVTITFAPMTQGPKTASLAVSGNPGGTGTASLTGKGLSPASLSISPPSVSFATPVQLFNPGVLPTTSYVVSNGGDLPSGTLSASLAFGTGTGNTEFAITADTCSGNPLAGQSTCSITVKFQPTTHGNKSATLQVSPGGLSATVSGTAQDQVQLTVSKAGAGTGTVTDSMGVINCGSTCSGQFVRTTTDPMVTLTAAAGTNSVFAGWSVAACGTSPTCVVTLSAATTVTATFNLGQVALTVNFKGIGTQSASISSSPAGISCSGVCSPSAQFNIGTSVTLTVTQAAGAMIAWSNGCTGTTCKVTMNAATTLSVMSTNQNVVFVTSQQHSGYFGGVAGANAFCNQVAAAGGVPGHFAAFLGTSTTTAFANLGTTARGWIRPDGLPFTDTVAGFQNYVMWYPATLNEAGTAVSSLFYTGSLINTLTCGDWPATPPPDAGSGSLGSGGQGSEGNYFFGIDGISCAGASVVCFGTDLTAAVSVSPVSGRHVFATRSPFTPGGGLAAADSLCQSEAQTAGLANPTRFLAALPTTTASVSSRFNLGGATWVRADGVQVASSPMNFMAGTLIAPPSTDAKGTTQQFEAFLGSSSGLTGPAASVAENCSNWTTASATANAILFEPIWGGPAFPSAFTEFSSAQLPCSTSSPIMCLEN